MDLGILQRTDRVWASDTNDALERQDSGALLYLLGGGDAARAAP